MDAPVRPGENPPVFLRDIGVVENGTDILTAYAHVNGKRTVYMQITKRSEASTLDVIKAVRANLPGFKAVCPEDVDVRVEFDQSTVVTQSLRTLANEAVLGAVLTGLMVLLFLRDWRSSLIVITTIPVALLSALVGLWALGQTINIMTLGGLALAVGVLVDEATVEIENIHAHMAGGLARVQSVLEACQKTAMARLLSMLTILAVFAPALFMTGVGRQLFVPLSLAVALAMGASYVLSSTLVPVLAAKFVRPTAHRPGNAIYSTLLGALLPLRWVLAPLYLLVTVGLIYVLLPTLGTELFPTADAGQFKLRLRAATGTRIERTEEYALQALKLIQREVPVEISSAFIGVQPASYPINTIFLWTSGPHEAVFQVALKPQATLRGEALRERLRAVFAKELPQVQMSFEAGDIVSDVMSFGSPTPVEVAVQGPALPANRAHAEKVMAELQKLPALRDLQFAQLLLVELAPELFRPRAAFFFLRHPKPQWPTGSRFSG
ncbi:MAG: hypothetical protein B7X34_03190 [Acidobacteriia bacterium 12-62-4]|nr:MAG: hypothetical protein B7X34_03190 [Acidobacteriia bacterium 12-62-4]